MATPLRLLPVNLGSWHGEDLLVSSRVLSWPFRGRAHSPSGTGPAAGHGPGSLSGPGGGGERAGPGLQDDSLCMVLEMSPGVPSLSSLCPDRPWPWLCPVACDPRVGLAAGSRPAGADVGSRRQDCGSGQLRPAWPVAALPSAGWAAGCLVLAPSPSASTFPDLGKGDIHSQFTFLTHTGTRSFIFKFKR